MDTSFQIKNHLSELVTLRNNLLAWQKTFALSQKSAAEINLILDELITNIIEHGDTENEHIIEISLIKKDKELTLIVTDDGPPFDPTICQSPDTKQPLEKRTCGGLGIHLVKKLCNRCSYTRSLNKNILTLKKILPEDRR